MTTSTTKRRVAVVAIHGVADHKPHESAGAIARLLQNLKNAEYSPFTERTLSIPVRPLTPSQPRQDFSQRRMMGGRFHTEAAYKAVVQDKVDISQEFITGQIECYKADDPAEAYETTRLEGTRGDTAVDVYEMYWTDLSKRGGGALHVFQALYQLLFHLPSLGMHTVRAAYLKCHARTKIWRNLSTAVNGSAFCIAVLLPVINLIMLGFTLTALATYWLKSHESVQAVVSLAVPVIVSLGLLAVFLLDRKPVPRACFVLPLIPAAAAIIASVWPAGFFAPLRNQMWYGSVSAVFSLGLVIGILYLYQTQRPDRYFPIGNVPSRMAAVIAVGIVWAVRVFFVRNTNDPVIEASLNMVELGTMALGIATLILSGFLWASHALGFYAKRTAHDRAEAFSVVWTARLTLTLPTILFLVFTLGLWAALVKAIENTGIRSLCYTAVLPWQKPPANFGELSDVLLAHGATLYYSAILCCFGAALAFVLWAVLPSAVSETATSFATAKGLGSWLDNGFALMRWSGRCIYVAITVLLPAGSVLAILNGLGSDYNLARDLAIPAALRDFVKAIEDAGSPGTFVRWTGSAMLALTLALLSMRGASSELGSSFRAVLDVMLDVDNYLREFPKDNPKARIFGRLASLLRFIAGENYDKVIIVAHSQGSVIIADFMRYVRCASEPPAQDYEPLLKNLGSRMTLFTMGSPLRQLYGLRFPHLYAWATLAPGAMDPLPHDIQPESLPDPKDLGVEAWVNAYRSGDYIGRALWRQDSCKYTFSGKRRSADAPATRRTEFCIGAGAHTRYWNKDGGQIAQELDKLI